MCLTIHNQLTLLHDLLDDQLTYNTVSMDEYRQIKKLVQSMIVQRQVGQELLSILPEIYYFGIKGENAHSFSAHIHENKQKIKYWLHLINQTKFHRSS